MNRRIYEPPLLYQRVEQRRYRQFHVSRNSWAAQAERTVRRELEKLPMDRFIIAHDIRFKYGNIDHLVIRDDGRIILIETKAYRGEISTDGQNLLIDGRKPARNPICQMQRSIRSLKRFSKGPRPRPIWIDAYLVMPYAQCRSSSFRIGGCRIVVARQLQRRLLDLFE